jgi:cyclopropane-fatty-acyl-phospholipid synthase
MSLQQQQAMASSISPSLLRWILRRLVGKLDYGQLIVEAPGGSRMVFEGLRPGPHARVHIHSWRVLTRFFSGCVVSIAESYLAREWSSPNLAALLVLGDLNTCLGEPQRLLRLPRLGLKFRHALNRNTRAGSRRNIAAHYDLGNDFYQQWLDAGMNYSAGIFSREQQTLEEAQQAKIDRVCEMLELRDGDRVLEIGCGWGAVAQQLREKHDAAVTGITLSAEQLNYARRRTESSSMAKGCDLRFQDYRDVAGSFDRIVSIEMLEAVGEAYWPVYFQKLHDSLRPGGIAVLQVITMDEGRFETYRARPDFIQKYIFPGGMLPTVEITRRETENAGLVFAHAEFFGVSYVRTLEEWKQRFETAWPTLSTMGFDARFKRMWEYYLAYCQAGFETGALNVGLYRLERPS